MRAVLVLLVFFAACVERRLHIRTDPPGASIRVNGEHVGESPVSWPFQHYGRVLVEARKEGFEPAQEVVDLDAPFYQQPGIDFFADVLLPVRIRDEHEVALALSPTPDTIPEEELEEMRRELAAAAARLREASRPPIAE